MKAIKYGVLATLCMSANLYAMPISTEVGKLAISNHTTRNLTVSLNKVCSSDIGSISAYSVKTLSTVKLIKICAQNSGSSCDIVAYDGSNCTGNDIGRVEINFATQSMVVSGGNDKHIGVAGSIRTNQYNIFFHEEFGPDRLTN